jgi:tetratricopeptide (TPR) repeat protein
MLGLREGGLLWGSVESHDEGGIDFRRLDNGGHVRLPWNLLDPSFEHDLRQRYGYVDIAEEEVMVSADRLRTVDGREIVGRIIDRTDDAIYVKTARSLVAVPMVRLAGPSTLVRVPALDVFTREELYQQETTARRAALAAETPEATRAHFELAQYCERILDYENAVRHYERAAELDPGFRPGDMQSVLARAQRKAAAQAQVDFLGEIRRERQLGNYVAALALAGSFRELFPDSPLFEDLNKLRASVLAAQERDLAEAVARRWHFFASRLVAKAARELEFEAATAWVDGQASDQVLAAVVEDVRSIDPDIDADRVRQLWLARERGRPHRASYGQGTWLLGEDRARAGLDDEKDASSGSERDNAREELEERIRRFLDQQRVAARSRQGADEEDPARFWSEWNHAGRAQWLLAHYAEFSSDFDVRDVQFRSCRDCGGTGVRELISTGPAVSGGGGTRTRLLACPTCHHIGIVRRISYR